MEKEFCKTLLSNPLTTSEALVFGVRIKGLTQRRSLDCNSDKKNRVVFFILALVCVVCVFA